MKERPFESKSSVKSKVMMMGGCEKLLGRSGII